MIIRISLLFILPLFFLSNCDRYVGAGDKDSAAKAGTGDSMSQGAPPPRLVRDDGAFELAAVIEGVEANRRFMANLKLVNKQREDLQIKSNNLAALPTESIDERAAAEASINELESALRTNDDVMKRTYGYSLSANFILIPLEADLFEVKEGVKGSAPVHEIRATSQYDRLQDLRNRYDTATKSGAEKSTLADTLAAQLKKEFGFNIRSNYTLDIRKGALYRKIEN